MNSNDDFADRVTEVILNMLRRLCLLQISKSGTRKEMTNRERDFPFKNAEI